MTSIDEQFVEFIVKSLVNDPSKVSIERTIDEKGVLLELTVDPEDLGRVIGKRGATAQSIRTLLRALGTKNDARYNLKIVDNGEPRPPREEREEKSDRRDEEEASKSDSDDDEEKPEDKNLAAAIEDLTDDDDDDEKDDDDEQESDDEAKESLAERTRKELADLDDLDV